MKKLRKNFANLEREEPWSARSFRNILQNEFLVGRFLKEFGTKHDKFQLNRTSIQLENDQKV